MSNHSDLDKLLGFTKPIDEMTDAELQKSLMKFFAHTRPVGNSVEDMLKDPLLKGVANLEELIKNAGQFKLK
jgi:hypothetical protein